VSLRPGEVVRALALPLPHEPLPGEDVEAGAPTTGWVSLGGYAEAEVGVWEMTPGTAVDVEIDEVFVVLAGRASVEFTDASAPAIDLSAGDLVRLDAGMRTRWIVTETLRKVSVIANG